MRKKIIELPPTELQTDSDVFTDRMPLETLKELWNKNGCNYTDNQLFKMREFIYVLCEVLYKVVIKQQTKIIPLTSNEPVNERKEGYTIRPRKYRRAS